MQVKVLYFGVLRDVLGAADGAMELADGASVSDLLRILLGQTSHASMTSDIEPGGNERLWRSLAVAVNREYASASIVLRDGDEVALLPPVSGGTAHAAKGEFRSQKLSAARGVGGSRLRLGCRTDEGKGPW